MRGTFFLAVLNAMGAAFCAAQAVGAATVAANDALLAMYVGIGVFMALLSLLLGIKAAAEGRET